MPPAPRRTAGIRRPRVAGHAAPGATAPGTEVLDPPVGRTPSTRPPRARPAPAEPAPDDAPVTGPVGPDRPTVVGDEPPRARRTERATAAERAPRRSLGTLLAAPTSTRALSIWGAVALVLVALAAFFGTSWYNTTHTGAAANTALVDIGGTAQVAQQVDDDLRSIYSFDYARLDENEKDARAVITPEFGVQFDKIFADVRARAPQQQAVVTATVANSAVRELQGDHAVVVVFMDQIATRAGTGDAKQQIASSGRLTVTAQLVDGRWKVADVKAV